MISYHYRWSGTSAKDKLGGSGGTKSPRRPEALARGVQGGGAPLGKKCVLSYAIRDVTYFLSSDLWETRVEPYHENLMNKRFSSSLGETKKCILWYGIAMWPTFSVRTYRKPGCKLISRIRATIWETLRRIWGTSIFRTRGGKNNCVLSYGIRDVTHFLNSEEQETKVQSDQQEQGYNLRDSQENLRNKHFSDPGGRESEISHMGILIFFNF